MALAGGEFMENARPSQPAGQISADRRPTAVDPRGRVSAGRGRSSGWSEDRTLSGYWSMLGRRKGLIVAAALLGAGAGWLASLPQTPIYRATASMEVEALAGDPLRLAGAKPPPAPSRSLTEFYIATRAQILESRVLLERVVDELELERRFAGDSRATNSSRLAAVFGSLHFPTEDAKSKNVGPRELALAAAEGSYKVTPSRKAGIIEIASEWPEPQLSADFANTLAREFIGLHLETRWQAAERTEDWLGRQLDKLRFQLESSEDELRQYALDTGLLFTSRDGNVAEQRLRQLQAELSRAQADRIVKQSRFELADLRHPGELGGRPDIREYEMRRADLRRNLAELSTTYTPAHYKVKRVQAQLAELEKTIETERQDQLEGIRNEYETAQRRERLLSDDYWQQARLVSEQAGKSVQYNILSREVDTYRQLYDHLLRQVKEAGVLAAMGASDIRIVDPAVPPTSPIRPDHALNSLLGLTLGLLSGVTLAFVRERRDRALREPGESREFLQLPELGVIPVSRDDRIPARGMYGWRTKKSGPHFLGNGSRTSLSSRELGAAARGRVELVSWEQKASPLAECFRVATTSIVFLASSEGPLRRLVVSSPHPGEGKTTVAANLAIILAEIHGRVLLVDADLRRPRLHDIFNVPNKWGFGDLLQQGGVRTAGEADTLGLRTDVPGLYLLPSGSNSASVTNLLHSARAEDLLRRFHSVFNVVLFDSPPMMEFSEARVLGQLSNGVVLVLRAGVTSRDDALAAREKFAEDGTRVLGTVLNAWDSPTALENGAALSYYQSYSKEPAAEGETRQPRQRAAAAGG